MRGKILHRLDLQRDLETLQTGDHRVGLAIAFVAGAVAACAGLLIWLAYKFKDIW